MKWRSIIPVVIVVLVLAALIGTSMTPQAVRVETSLVSRSRLNVSVDDEGVTRVRQRYTVSAPVTARLLRVELDAGDSVKQGDVLLKLVPLQAAPLDARALADAKLALESARAAWNASAAQLKLASAEHEYAKKELARSRDMSDKEESVLTIRELDLAVRNEAVAASALQAAEFSERMANFEMQRAQTALTAAQDFASLGDTLTIRAPLAGKVLRVLQESEGVVAAGTPILELGDPASLEIVVDLLSSDAVKIAPGMRAVITRWGGEGELEASVRVVEPSGFTKISTLGVEEQRVNVVLDPSGENEAWQRLGDQYRVEVAIVLWERADTLTVPASAVFRHDGGWAVYALDGSSAELRNVRIGQRTSLLAQVLDGLSDRDEVIVHPSKEVADGVSVEVVE